jgi:5,10-methylenetetrahydromethanopterin reductase
MALAISCAFATSLTTPDHIVLAERLGYHGAWCYDSPALYPDVWMMLAEAAAHTRRIRLGPGVLIPSLRHPMTSASAIATLAARARGRVVVGIGAGFTGRLTLGQRPLSWRFVQRYIEALRGLLHGDEVEWDGTVMQMLHPAGYAPARPIAVPLLVGAGGPKGFAVARAVGDGVVTVAPTVPQGPFPWAAQFMVGTVLEPGEDPGSARVLAAAGHVAALIYHGRYTRGGGEALAALPGGEAWRQRVEQVPLRTRHLATHAMHLIGLNTLDDGVVTPEVLRALGVGRDAAAWQARLKEAEAAGVAEVVYQPGGPDIERELRAFADMAGL